jgi:hypothetical protein
VSHGSLKGDLVTETEVVNVSFKVGENLTVMGKVGIVSRHGKVGVAHAIAGGIDVQRLIGRRHAAVVEVAPVATDAGAFFKAIERNCASVQNLSGGDSG